MEDKEYYEEMKKYYEKITVSEFLKKIEEYKEEIGCDGKKIGAHKLPSNVSFIRKDKEGGYTGFKLIEIRYDTLMGCACPSGIIFILEQDPED